MTTPLLQTKLYIPPVRPAWVLRPRLIERLNAGLGRKLTLISAPAGFGKTTLVSEWAHRQGGGTAAADASAPLQLAWLSLAEDDNDPARFLTYLIAALQAVKADIGKGALSALQSPHPPSPTAVLTPLINELAALPDRIVLVLDDYHLIDDASRASAPIHDALAFMLEHLPPPPAGVHLVLLTREDPPLPLARLRARGQLAELRAADLKFVPPESTEFLNKVMGLDLSPKDIAALEARTEGWIAGLQLAALALQGALAVQGQADASRLIQSFSGSHRYVLDYLIEEVLAQQPESTQEFLLRTAILDRLCGSLCDALTGQENGQATLERLDHANLFIVPLDSERRWYRYHHLFADLLRQRLHKNAFPLSSPPAGAETRITELHIRASLWYQEHSLELEAFHHAAAAQDFERAADLAELAWPAMSGSFQSIAWLDRVKVLPDELVRARPVLCVGYAWALLNSGRPEDAEARLLDAERWLEPTDGSGERLESPSTQARPEQSLKMVVVDQEQFRSLPASLATARAYHAQAIGDLSATIKYAEKVLDLLPEGTSKWRGDATALLGLAYWARGDLDQAHWIFSEGLGHMSPLDAIVGTFVLADIKTALGQLGEAVRAYKQSLQLAQEHGEPLGTEDLHTGIGELYRERGDLDAAEKHLLTGKRLGEQIELPDWQYRWCIAQARLRETRGDLDGALALLDEAERLFVRTPLPQVRPIAAHKTRIWVAQGKLAQAQEWVREQGLSVHDRLSYLHEFEHLTLARVLIARYKSAPADGTIQEAMRLLERLLQAAEAGKRAGSVIEILVLQALAHEAQGHIPAALVSLERALALAEPEGYFRVFVDEGPPMARLLYRAGTRGIMKDYAGKLLAAFPDREASPIAPPSIPTSKIRPSELLEPLSERELEVLQLVADGLTNPEIASRLYVSLNTIKAHTRNTYSKLGVHNRVQAVARARALGLLPSL